MEFKEQKLGNIRNQLDIIIAEIETKSEKGAKLHEVERHLFSSLLALGLRLLSYYVLLISQQVKQSGRPVDKQGKKMQHKGKQSRDYFGVFGRLSIERVKYYSPLEKTHYALDAALGLPSGVYSYLLEDWMAFGAVEMDFSQSVSSLERILGHRLHGMQSSRCTYHLSGEVESFYEQQDPCFDKKSTHLSVGYDGKGIPIRRAETERAQESMATRLSKGHRDADRSEMSNGKPR